MKRLLISLGLAFLVTCAWAQQERKFIRKGTSEYNSEKYAESETEYRKALDKDPRSYEAQFNVADALYKQKKLDKALEQFQSLAGSQTDKNHLSQIYHNMGNIYFANGKFDESINAYKNALKNNPADNETRYNLIAAQKKKQQQDQQNKQDQQQQQQKQQQDQQKQEQQKDQDKQDKKDQQQQQQQQQNQMNKQDAERLLNAMQQDEDDLQKEKRKVKAAEQAIIEKNW